MSVVNSELKNISGIYFIRNLINNREYIGSSKNIYYRLEKHMSLLKHGKHQNPILQNSVIKHGIENFTCGLLEVCDTESLGSREEFYIQNSYNSYNIRKEVIRPINTPEINRKHSETKKRLFREGLILPSKTRCVNLFDIWGNFIEKFNSIKECSNKTGISKSECRRILNKSILESHGYFIKYSNDISPINLKMIFLSSFIRGKHLVVVLTNLKDEKDKFYFSTVEKSLFKLVKGAGSRYYNILNSKIENKIKYNNKYYKIGLLKPCELLEHPEILDNQQLIIDGNIYESSTTTQIPS